MTNRNHPPRHRCAAKSERTCQNPVPKPRERCSTTLWRRLWGTSLATGRSTTPATSTCGLSWLTLPAVGLLATSQKMTASASPQTGPKAGRSSSGKRSAYCLMTGTAFLSGGRFAGTLVNMTSPLKTLPATWKQVPPHSSQPCAASSPASSATRWMFRRSCPNDLPLPLPLPSHRHFGLGNVQLAPIEVMGFRPITWLTTPAKPV